MSWVYKMKYITDHVHYTHNTHFRAKAKFLTFEDKWYCLSCCHIGMIFVVNSISFPHTRQETLQLSFICSNYNTMSVSNPSFSLEELKIWGASKLILNKKPECYKSHVTYLIHHLELLNERMRCFTTYMVVIPVISVALRHKTKRMSVNHAFICISCLAQSKFHS